MNDILKQGQGKLKKPEEILIQVSVKNSRIYSKNRFLYVILVKKYMRKSIVFLYNNRLNVRYHRVTEMYLNMLLIALL